MNQNECQYDSVISLMAYLNGGFGGPAPTLLEHNPQDLSKNIMKLFNKGFPSTCQNLKGVV